MDPFNIVKFLLLLQFFVYSGIISGQSYNDRDSINQNPRIYLNAGGYFPRVNTSLRVDGENVGTEIKLEDQFNFLRELSVFRADAIVRASRRSQFVFSYTQLKRGSEFKLDEEIKFADTSFAINAQANMYFDTYYYALTYRYAFWDRPNWNAGLSAGIRFVEFRTGLSASLNDFEPYSAEASFIAPAIVFGIHGGAYLSPRFIARYSLEFLRLKIAGMDINIVESQFSLSYYITKSIGIGGAYSTNSYRVTDLPFGDAKGRVEFDFGGANLFVTARF